MDKNAPVVCLKSIRSPLVALKTPELSGGLHRPPTPQLNKERAALAFFGASRRSMLYKFFFADSPPARCHATPMAVVHTKHI